MPRHCGARRSRDWSRRRRGRWDGRRRESRGRAHRRRGASRRRRTRLLRRFGRNPWRWTRIRGASRLRDDEAVNRQQPGQKQRCPPPPVQAGRLTGPGRLRMPFAEASTAIRHRTNVNTGWPVRRPERPTGVRSDRHARILRSRQAALPSSAGAHASRRTTQLRMLPGTKRRGVDQSGRSPALGAGGRRFESGRPDHAYHRSRHPMLIALTFAAALVVGLFVTPIVRGVRPRPGPARSARRTQGPPGADPASGRRGDGDRLRAGVGVATFVVAATWVRPRGLRPNRAPAILAGVGTPGGVGIVDDVRGMRALVKLGFQVAAAVVAWCARPELDRLYLPWAIVELGPLALPITVAWIVGVINAINLIDGLDGLAAGVVADRPRRVRAARGRRRRRSDPADHRGHRRRGGRLPRLQPAPGDDHHGRHRIDVPRLRGGRGRDLADAGRRRSACRPGCRSSRSASRSSTRSGRSCDARRAARRSSWPIAATSITSCCGAVCSQRDAMLILTAASAGLAVVAVLLAQVD